MSLALVTHGYICNESGSGPAPEPIRVPITSMPVSVQVEDLLNTVVTTEDRFSVEIKPDETIVSTIDGSNEVNTSVDTGDDIRILVKPCPIKS